MPTYGPWVQGEDVTGTSSGYAGRDLRQTRTTDSSEWTQYSDGGTTASIVSGAINTERARVEPADFLADNISGASIGAQAHVAVGPTQTAPYPFTTGVVRDDAGLAMDASSVISGLQSTYAGTIALPPDATGVQLESSAFVVTAATVDLSMTDSEVNGLAGIYSVTTPMRVDFYVRPGGTPIGTPGRLSLSHTTTGTAGPTPATVTVTASGADLQANGGLIIWPESKPSASSAWSVSGAGPRDFSWSVGRRLVLSGAPSATWTLRPPRHRFVYAGGPTRMAPLRIVQRGNDGLGVTGGRRIIGAKTRQASNRRGTAIW